jgi:glycosyltransferase involved in cell wall biosynthesis
MKVKKIGVNLLCFDESNLAGTWYFFKRLWEALPTNIDAEFVFFCQKSFALEKRLKIPPGIRYKLVSTRLCRSRAMRILYEQLVLPVKCFSVDALFSPCVANPIFHVGFSTITTIHDLTPFLIKTKYSLLQGLYVRLITRLLAKMSTHIVTVSVSSRTDLHNYLGVPESEINIIYNFVPDRDLSRSEYGNYFLSVGTLQPAKNLGNVIRSFAIFKEQYDRFNHRLIIVGARGWGENDCERLIHQLGMEESILLAGYLPDEELDTLYARCKGLVLLSLYEGFGIPPLEALSWNKPSVVSNRSSLPEVVGTTGIQVDPFNCDQAAKALQAIAEEPVRYLTGRDRQLERFSAEKQVNKLLEVLGIENEAVSTNIRISQGIA